MILPSLYCDLSSLSVEDRHKLESNLKRFCGTCPHPEPPSDRAIGLRVELINHNQSIVTLTMMGRPEFLDEVTLPELKEIISNAATR